MKRAALVTAFVAAGVPMLSGCYNGFSAGTAIVEPAGDGTDVSVGDMQVQNAVWVRSSTEPTTLTLVATVANQGQVDDTLTGVQTVPPSFMGGTILGLPVASGASANIGYGTPAAVTIYGNTAPASSYIPTTFTFQNAGSTTVNLLSVAAVGAYAGIEPNPAKMGEKANDKQVNPVPSATPVPTESRPSVLETEGEHH